MATYVNDLRLKEIATGDEAGTWGTSTNTNLELIGEALGFGTQDCFSSDADATTTVADGATDPARSMYFKVTSSATLSATRTLTIAPNTISRVMIIENATTGSQSINISQGSGANVTIANGNVKVVYLDGAGSGAAVVDALIDLELADVASATIASLDVNGTATFNTGSGTTDNVVITGTDAGASTAPDLVIYRNSASPADGDNIGMVQFRGNNDAAAAVNYAAIFASINDASSSTEDGKLSFAVATANTEAPSAGTTFMEIDGGGDISFYEDTGTSVKFFWDASAESLGIGTTTVNEALVLGSADSGSNFLQITNSTTTAADNRGFYVGIDANEAARILNREDTNIIFSTNNTTRMTLDNSGNLGIGTTSPSDQLHIASGAAALRLEDTDNSTYGQIVYNTASGGLLIRSDEGAGAGTGSSNIIFETDGTPKVRIAAGGNVGIGTTSPAEKLDVSGAGTTRIQVINTNLTSSGLYVAEDSTGAQFNELGAYPMRFHTSGTERMRIESGGNVGIGTDSPLSTLDTRASTGGVLTLSTSDTAIQSATSDILGKIQFQAPSESSGTQAIKPAASISAVCEATNFNSSRNDTGLVFATNSTSANPVEGMRLDHDRNFLVGTTSTPLSMISDSTGNGFGVEGQNGYFVAKRSSTSAGFYVNKTGGNSGTYIQFRDDGVLRGQIFSYVGTRIGIGSASASGVVFGASAVVPATAGETPADNTYDLGSSSYRYDDIFATNGTIQTSDANEKQDVAELDEAERRVAVAAKGLLRKFRWKDSVAEKGDDARIHFGIIAQDLQAAFEAQGLDAGRYAMFIHSTWTDEETGEERSRMGVRYSELLAFIIAAL